MTNDQKLITSAVALTPQLIVKDDANLTYQIIDIFPHSMVVQAFPNLGNLGCEVITYKCFVDEKWQVIGKAY